MCENINFTNLRTLLLIFLLYYLTVDALEAGPSRFRFVIFSSSFGIFYSILFTFSDHCFFSLFFSFFSCVSQMQLSLKEIRVFQFSITHNSKQPPTRLLAIQELKNTFNQFFYFLQFAFNFNSVFNSLDT